jgi:hypothetical protein
VTRYQKILLIVGLVNIAMLVLFPPFDAVPLFRGTAHTFDGFYYVFGYPLNREINKSLLQLETLLVMINVMTAWLLLSGDKQTQQLDSGRLYRKGIAAMVIANLVVMLLFPPFETYSSILRLQVPSFDGFYLLFGDKSKRNFFIPILYMEVSFVLINALLFLLLFGESDRAQRELGPEQVVELAKRLGPDHARQLAKDLQQQVLVDSLQQHKPLEVIPPGKERRKRPRN